MFACCLSDVQTGCAILLSRILLATRYASDIFDFSSFLFWRETNTAYSNHMLLTAIHADDCQEWQQHTSKDDPLNCRINFVKYPPSGSRDVPYGRTDRRDEANTEMRRLTTGNASLGDFVVVWTSYSVLTQT